MTSSLIGLTFLKKAEALKCLLTTGGKLSVLLKDKSFLSSIKRRLKERAKRTDFKIATSAVDSELYCLNDAKVTWDFVNEFLLDCRDSNTNLVPLSSEPLMHAADYISSNIVVSIDDLNIPQNNETVEQITKLFPVLYIKDNCSSFFVNIHEFTYTPGSLDAHNDNLYDDVIEQGNDNEGKLKEKETLSKIGQPSLVDKFPSIIGIATDFIKSNGFSAQNRRRTDTGYSSGTTIVQIKNHLVDNIPGLKEHGISESTVRRLCQAPNKARNSATRYKSHVKARVGVKDNSYREYHEDAHYLFSRNKCRRELSSMYPDDVTIISTDDMAKVKGHFKTFLQMEKGSDYSYGDDEQPSVVKNAIGKCEFCPNYSFTSKTEKNRHMSVFHRCRKTTVSSKEFTCNFNNCGKMFTSRSCLNRHKNQFEHKERNAPKDPRNKSRRNPTKRLRKINEVLAQFDSDEEDSSDDDEEDTCSANPCKIQDDNSQSDVAWIQCDVCESWFHDFCISRGSNTDEFICKSCR